MNKITTLALVLCASLFAMQAASGSSYNTELALYHSNIKNTPSNNKLKQNGIQAYISFDPLDITDGPLMEAHFLTPSTFIDFDFSKWSINEEVDVRDQKLGFTFVDIGQNLSVGLTKSKTEYSYDTVPFELSLDSIGMTVGYFIARGHYIELGRKNKTVKWDIPGSTSSKSKTDLFQIKNLFDLDGEQYIVLDINYEREKAEDGSSLKTLDVISNYYFTKYTGLEFRVMDFDSSDSNDNFSHWKSIGFSHFLTETTAIYSSYWVYKARDPNSDDRKGVQLALGIRF